MADCAGGDAGIDLLGLVAAGISCAPSAEKSAESDDSERDRIFAEEVKTERDIDLPDSTVIAAAHAVCSDFESDVPFLEVLSNAVDNTGLSQDDANFLAGVSVVTYCPQFDSSTPSTPDDILLFGLESERIDLPDSTAIAAGHMVCSDLESDVPFGEVISNAVDSTGLSPDDAGFLTAVSVGAYCPQFTSDLKFLALLDEEGVDLPASTAIAAGHAVCSDFESGVPFEEIALNALDKMGLWPERAGFLVGLSVFAYCPQFESQLPGS